MDYSFAQPERQAAPGAALAMVRSAKATLCRAFILAATSTDRTDIALEIDGTAAVLRELVAMATGEATAPSWRSAINELWDAVHVLSDSELRWLLHVSASDEVDVMALQALRERAGQRIANRERRLRQLRHTQLRARLSRLEVATDRNEAVPS